MSVLNQASGENWQLYHGDSCEVLRELPSDSVGMTLYSPPYQQIYSYSNSPRDLSNSRTEVDFWVHYRFIIAESLRLTKPGRNVCVDAMTLPATLGREGFIGLVDFRGRIIAEHIKAGFIWHSEFCIWRDPLIEATRTKSLGLLHGQLCKDSAMSRAGIPAYMLVFRKPGKNAEPIAHEKGLEYFPGLDEPTNGNLSHERWRRLASPVWTDIDFTNTLNVKAARAEEDTRHICPMSMDIINRALLLYSNELDVCLDPFSGIGSTGYCAVKNGRRFIGCELKDEYWEQAALNLAAAADTRQTLLY